MISRRQARDRLAAVWFVGAAILFFVVFLQSVNNHYGEKTTDAWGWLLPTILPTLTLMIGVFVAESTVQKVQDEPINGFVFWLTLAISVAYLLFVVLTIFFSLRFNSADPLALMKQSNLWLAPVQGLASASIGIFFARQSGRVPAKSNSADSAEK